MKPFADRTVNIKPSTTVEIDSSARYLSTEGRSIWNLGVGEPDFETPTHIKNAAINALNKGLTRYTSPDGLLPFKEAVCAKLLRENGLKYKASQIIATSGAKHAVCNSLSAIVNAGDEVLIPVPYWVTYPELVRFFGGYPVLLQCNRQNKFRLTAKQIEAAITPHTKAIILNSPCNPTGVVYSKAEIESFAEVIMRYDLYCISDEIYEHFIYSDKQAYSIAKVPGMAERTLIANGLSKAFCMTGWRIGYLAVPENIAFEIAKVQGQTTHHPSNISQYGAIAALNGAFDSVVKMREEFYDRMQRMYDILSSIRGVVAFKPDGAFYIFADISSFFGKKTKDGTVISDSVSFCKNLLAEQGVVIVPGAAFGIDSCVRFSFTVSLSNISVAMQRFREFIERLD